MSWPLSQDYNEAVQDPASCFADDELRRGQAATNALGIPLPRSGNFADVYELACPGDSRWAVKCFTREVPGLRDRYAAVSEHLQQARLPFAVDFRFLEQGVRVRGAWYPVLKMRWVEGLLLNDFVRDSLDKPALLQALLQIWVRMGRRLREAGVAHADLQHGNVILVPGRKAESLAVRLIDYDGMWVAALAGKRSGEVGHPNYQHPRRLREGTYGPQVDRFPLLVVATALQALAAGGRGLWERYDNGDNLLFREDDLRDPDRSRLFAQLRSLPDPFVQALVVPLWQACKAPLDATPHLDELLPEEGAPAAAIVAAPPLPVAVKARPTEVELLPEAEAVPEEEFPEAVVRRPRRRRRRSGVPAWAWAAAGVTTVVVGLATALAVMRAVKPSTTGADLALDVSAPPTHVPPTTQRASSVPSTATKSRSGPGEGAQPPQPPAAATPPVFRMLGESDDMLAIGDPHGSFWVLLNPVKNNSERAFRGHDRPITCVACTPDGRRVATGSADGTVRVWNPQSEQALAVLRGHRGPVVCVAMSADGSRVVSADGGPGVRLWDVATQRAIRTLILPSPIAAVALSPDGEVIACGEEGGGAVERPVRLLRAGDDTVFLLQPGHAGGVTSLAFSPDGRMLASGGADRVVRFWDTSTRQPGRRSVHGFDAPVRGVRFSADGARVVADCGFEAVAVVVRTGQVLAQTRRAPGELVACAFEPGGARMAVMIRAAGGGMVRESLPLAQETDVVRNTPAPGVWTQRDLRHPVPSETELAAARKELREMFPEAYTKGGSELAAKLSNTGFGPGNQTPMVRYAALTEAMDLNVQLGRFSNTLRLADMVVDRYKVSDPPELRCSVVEKSARIVRQEAPGLVDKALEMAAQARAEEDFDRASRLVKTAQTAVAHSRRLGQPEAVARAARETNAAGREFAPVKAALRTLEINPDDPAANLTAGRFRCFVRDDWERGLPLLAKGSDAALTALARKDLAVSDNAPARKELADAWLQQANKSSGAEQAAFRRRAHYCYKEALAGLEGPARAEAAGRLASLELQLPQLKDRWGHMNLAGGVVNGDHVSLPRNKFITTRKAYVGGVDLTVVARTPKNNIRLNLGDGGEVIFNWEGKPGELRVHAPSGVGRYPGPFVGGGNVPLEPNVWHTLRWRQTATKMEIWADGTLVFERKGQFDLTLPRPVGVRSHDSAIDVQSVEVRPVRGS
jgi:hypothetical protein